MPKGDVKIRWIQSQATRTKGHVETWPQDDLLAVWIERGWVEIVSDKEKTSAELQAETQAAEAQTKAVDAPPVDRSMKGKGSKKRS